MPDKPHDEMDFEGVQKQCALMFQSMALRMHEFGQDTAATLARLEVHTNDMHKIVCGNGSGEGLDEAVRRIERALKRQRERITDAETELQEVNHKLRTRAWEWWKKAAVVVALIGGVASIAVQVGRMFRII